MHGFYHPFPSGARGPNVGKKVPRWLAGEVLRPSLETSRGKDQDLL